MIARPGRRGGLSLLLALAVAWPAAADLFAPRALLEDNARALRAQAARDERGLSFKVNSVRDQSTIRSRASFALRDVAYGLFHATLARPDRWCEIMLLHLNVKGCVHGREEGRPVLYLYLGRKYYQEPGDASAIRFEFSDHSIDESTRVTLTAETGPFGTSGYVYVLEAIPVAGGVYVEFGISSHIGPAGALIDLYLSTLARGKVGFSRVEGGVSGRPRYVRGQLGAAERNAVRYMLALETTLKLLSEPFAERASAWYDATMRYPLQLRELDREDYLRFKAREYENQLSLQRAADARSE